jgi:hypothetical protein
MGPTILNRRTEKRFLEQFLRFDGLGGLIRRFGERGFSDTPIEIKPNFCFLWQWRIEGFIWSLLAFNTVNLAFPVSGSNFPIPCDFQLRLG